MIEVNSQDLCFMLGPLGGLAAQMAQGYVSFRLYSRDAAGQICNDITLHAQKEDDHWNCAITFEGVSAVKVISDDIAAQEFEATLMWLRDYVFGPKQNSSN